MGVNEFINELTILSHRNLYEKMGVPTGQRITMVNRLAAIIKNYEPILKSLNENRNVNIPNLLAFKQHTDSFVKNNFAASFWTRYNTLPPEERKTDNEVVKEAIVDLALMALKQKTNIHLRQHIREHKHKCQLLCEAKQCLEDGGLHPAISKREKSIAGHYNVMIELKEKKTMPEFELMLTRQELDDQYLAPYRNKTDILINGKIISFKNIVRIKFSSTLLQKEETDLFKRKYQLEEDGDFFAACTDETNLLTRQNFLRTDTGKASAKQKAVPKKRLTKDEKLTACFIRGIQELQEQGIRQPFIESLKKNTGYDEGGFRDWFKTWFKAQYESAEAEPLKEDGRIDLKISDKTLGTRIVEFKGWWNQDRIAVVQQLYKYLTDFEHTGYLFMVNHLKNKDITTDYAMYIKGAGTGFIGGSWKIIPHQPTDHVYFSSQHKIGSKTKTLIHFIYHLYP